MNKKLYFRLWGHIDKSRQKQLILLLPLIILVSIAEIMSIGAVLPFLAVITSPESVFNDPVMNPVIQYFGLNHPNQLLTPISLIFASFALLAGVFRIVLIYVQTILGNYTGADLSIKIYKHTLLQPYSIHVERNSSQVIAGISTKTNQVVAQILMPVIQIISSVFLMIAILFVLIIADPIVAIASLVGFSLIYLVITFLTKRRLHSNGEIISNNTNQVVKVVQEGLGGIRDIIIDQTHNIFCQKYNNIERPLRQAHAINQIIGASPRYGIEGLGMALIAILAYVMTKNSENPIDILPVLGMIAVGAQRLLPILQQIYNSWANAYGAVAVLKDVLVLLDGSNLVTTRGKLVGFSEKLSLNRVGFHYARESNPVLRNITFEIKKGSKVGIIGTTGSGKSTLVDIVLGLLHPTEGALLVDGVQITRENASAWQSCISHIPQTIFLSDSTVLQNIAFGVPKNEINYKKVYRAAKNAQISKDIHSWDDGYDTVVGENGMGLSGGQRQRIGIARALYKEAELIVLDEATSALDVKTEELVMDSINSDNANTTTLIVAHRISILQGCDQIIEIKNGRIHQIISYDNLSKADLP